MFTRQDRIQKANIALSHYAYTDAPRWESVQSLLTDLILLCEDKHGPCKFETALEYARTKAASVLESESKG